MSHQSCVRLQVSTLLVAPVAPHWAEEVWTSKLGRPGCVVTAGWPTAAEPDLVLQVPPIAIDVLVVLSLRRHKGFAHCIDVVKECC